MNSSATYIIKQLIKIGLVIALAVALFLAGTMIGYGVIGEGKVKDVFKESTWTHITDFVKK